MSKTVFGALPTPEDIRAARAWLGWTQADLGDHVGLSSIAIANIEKKKFNPTAANLQKIQGVFFENDIEFLPEGGFKKRTDKIRILDGEDNYLTLMDEIYRILKRKPENREVLIAYADQRRSTDTVIEAQKRMMKAGIELKITVCEGDKYLLYPLENYRYIPKEDFLNSAIVVYDDYVSISVGSESKKLTVIHDATIAEVFRRQFKTLWEMYEKPTEALLEK